MDEENLMATTDLFNGEGLCARCAENPIESVFEVVEGVALGFCGEECLNRFVRGMEAAKDLSVL